MAVKLDARLFQQHIKNLVKYWNSMPDAFQNVDAILIPVGESSEETVYQKSTALQTWLFLYEFPDTNCLITNNKLYVLASQKKCAILDGLNDITLAESKIEVVTFARNNKDPQASAAAMDGFLDLLKDFKRVGVFSKDKPSGKWINEWKSAYESVQSQLEEVDVSAGVATVLAVKDESEIKNVRLAGKMSSLVMKNYFLEEMAAIVDDEKEISHEKFAEKVENVMYDDKARRKLQFPPEIATEYVDNCYTPIIQSGGVYDLKPSATSSKDKLHAGIILCSLGIRYRNYCSNVSRTFLIDPTKKQEARYNFLLELQKYVMAEMKDGVSCADVYAKATAFVQEKQPELLQKFVKNLGFVIGLEFRDSNYVLNAKNPKELYANMTVNLSLGFQDLTNSESSDPKEKNYSLLLADTVVVGAQGTAFLTDAPREFRFVSFFFKDEEEEVAQKQSPAKEAKSTKSAILKSKLRSDVRSEENLQSETKRKSHQKSLLEDRIKDGLSRFSTGDSATASEEKKVFKRFESYKKDSLLPKETKQGRIVIDRRNETVLLPVMGMSVPFHLNTIKNVTKSEEGQYLYLRFNFNAPNQIAKKDDTLPYEDPTATFIKNLSYRSTDTVRYNELHRQINELKKEIIKKENEKRQKADLIEQDRLVESKRPLGILSDVHVRPGLEGKKLPGDVQIHANGLRYQPVRGDQKVDILYSNIKHLFFQPCDHELYVIMHCHLKNPIMVGKKKTKDVQFYRDVSDGGFDETSNRRNKRQFYNDEDELMAEQEERRRKQKMNKEFKMFAEKITEVSGYLEADVPIRELGFSGVPVRTNVLMQPTTECLVHLTDAPFTVITLADVEIAYLERVQFHLRNYDLVFVMKDFKTAPLHVNTIPMKQLEPVKEWLDSVDIPYIEGPFNLNWANIMKNINQDPAGFYEDGGWANLASEGGQAETEEDEEDSASEFEMSGDASSEEEEEVSEESDFDEEDDEESEEDFDEEESEGEDWDDLERKALKHDEKKRVKESSRHADSDDDLRPKKKRK